MNLELQCKKELIIDNSVIELSYYLTSEESREQEHLCYGIQIELCNKIGRFKNASGKLTYSKEEVIEMISYLARHNVTPTGMIENIDEIFSKL